MFFFKFDNIYKFFFVLFVLSNNLFGMEKGRVLLLREDLSIYCQGAKNTSKVYSADGTDNIDNICNKFFKKQALSTGTASNDDQVCIEIVDFGKDKLKIDAKSCSKSDFNIGFEGDVESMDQEFLDDSSDSDSDASVRDQLIVKVDKKSLKEKNFSNDSYYSDTYEENEPIIVIHKVVPSKIEEFKVSDENFCAQENNFLKNCEKKEVEFFVRDIESVEVNYKKILHEKKSLYEASKNNVGENGFIKKLKKNLDRDSGFCKFLGCLDKVFYPVAAVSLTGVIAFCFIELLQV